MHKILKLALLLLSISTAFAAEDTKVANKHPELTVYTAKGCGYCRSEMAYLHDNNIKFKEVSVNNEDGRLDFDDAGGIGTPLTVYGKAKLQGYTESDLVKFLFYNQVPK